MTIRSVLKPKLLVGTDITASIQLTILDLIDYKLTQPIPMTMHMQANFSYCAWKFNEIWFNEYGIQEKTGQVKHMYRFRKSIFQFLTKKQKELKSLGVYFDSYTSLGE